ncbi:oligopeptide transport system ATP-binding protein [Amycolatopsis sacchari]|uniref:Oligopeptide transport system ATP-binding protein n=1 Tax=Amycolatopsis sacchari TaxID=115433 RepID=A0A1I3UZC9_9PSEU|nr:oligopeptide/dipeptide ABC transporter ATP-binding protein [Amycolatopsis sacchari]SFJ88578.1 oligopeptide transport system ATP-binding protein [Amycolatopsis sacchari]
MTASWAQTETREPKQAPTPLLDISDLHVHFPVPSGAFGHQTLRAVDGVSLTVAPGETLGLVGESGSGKSTVARAVARIEPVTSGEIRVAGSTVSGRKFDEKELRRTAQMIFQDPRGSLNPRHTIYQAVREPLDIHRVRAPGERSARVDELLRLVGLNPAMRDRYPGSLSGGQLQRVAIARALAVEPKLLLCDEPVSSLDVSVQAQVVNLLAGLQSEFGVAYLFIAHDLAVVRHLSHRIAVMYLGSVVETAPTSELFSHPRHPYTRALIDAVPDTTPAGARDQIVLKGDIPSPLNVPSGCRFRTRCPWARERCATEAPQLRETDGAGLVACHFAEEIAEGTLAQRTA